MRGATFTEAFDNEVLAISTHTPHAGRDTKYEEEMIAEGAFLLTRPMRGATDAAGTD